MELEDFFSFKDFFRTMLLASALIFFIGTVYGIFLHAMYASQIIGVKQDLYEIHHIMMNRSEDALKSGGSEGVNARAYRDIAIRAEIMAKKINAPPVTPTSYTYFNYWLSSAAFTTLDLDDEILGLDEKTINTFQQLDKEMLFGEPGWWNRTDKLKTYSSDQGKVVQFLREKPRLRTYWGTFYFFIFFIGLFTAFLTVKEEYEIPTLPEIIYGLFMPLPFFIIYALIGILAYLD
ncbi:hypothetical protein K8R43_00620, partial [archaeon]|nr:hypothetical protein [archaeon]